MLNGRGGDRLTPEKPQAKVWRCEKGKGWHCHSPNGTGYAWELAFILLVTDKGTFGF